MMKEIGLVTSPSSETEAQMVLNEGLERDVKVEDIVLIDNKAGNQILAVCRKGIGINDNIRADAFSPGVAYAKNGRKPSSAKEFYSFHLSVIGDVTGSLKQNKLIIAPSSNVSMFEPKDNPMTKLGAFDATLGFYKEHPTWPVPVNAKFIPYHIGIFAVTGGGKSFLARCEVIPLFLKSKYDVIIFDWKGSDYAPHFGDTVKLGDIALDDDVVISYLASKMDYFGYSGEYKYRNNIHDALEDVIYEGKWRQIETAKLRAFLEDKVVTAIEDDCRDTRGNITVYGQRNIRKFKKYINRLRDPELEGMLGKMTPEDIVKLAREKHILVLDVSEGGKDEKLSIFLSVAKHLQHLMEAKQVLNLALVIDEGPQYAPFKPTGIEEDTTETISQLCALGRSYHLAVVILSQGIAGEIGINASIRRNLNTQFIGKIHPLDIYEASSLLAGLNLDPTFLVSLPEGHFYFLGNMNPSPIPLLISFNIK